MNCEHKFDCGCEKSRCEECEEYFIENDNNRGVECQDEDCCEYYRHRNDNCDCHGFDCGYCNGEAEKELRRDSAEPSDDDFRKLLKKIDPGLKDKVIAKWNREILIKELKKRILRETQK